MYKLTAQSALYVSIKLHIYHLYAECTTKENLKRQNCIKTLLSCLCCFLSHISDCSNVCQKLYILLVFLSVHQLI